MIKYDIIYHGGVNRTIQLDAEQGEKMIMNEDNMTESSLTTSNYENILDQCMKIANDLGADRYIWNNEGFSLRLVSADAVADDADKGMIISGSTTFDDCFVDEWYIVYILREISKAIDTIYVYISDEDDGQFLLIEAAEALPKWIDPESSKNRTFIYKGQLYIIGPDVIPIRIGTQSSVSESKSNICESPQKALMFALDFYENTNKNELRSIDNKDKVWRPMSLAVQIEAFRKIQGFPEEVFESNRHFIYIVLSIENAIILSINPKMITSIIKNMEMDQVKETSKGSGENKKKLVLMKAQFTRHCYAKLVNILSSNKDYLELYENYYDKDEQVMLFNRNDDSEGLCKWKTIKLVNIQLLQHRAWLIGAMISMMIDKMYDKAKERENSKWKQFNESLKRKKYFDEKDDEETNSTKQVKAKEKFYKDHVMKSLSTSCLEYFHQYADRIVDENMPSVLDVTSEQVNVLSLADDDGEWLSSTLSKSNKDDNDDTDGIGEIIDDLQRFVEHKTKSNENGDEEGDEYFHNDVLRVQNVNAANDSISFDPDVFLKILQGIEQEEVSNTIDEDKMLSHEDDVEEDDNDEEENEEVEIQDIIMREELENTTISELIQ